MGDCRIPKTATRRGAITYAKLLSRVDARAKDGFGFVGKFFRPGELVLESELGADYHQPAPILLECSEVAAAQGLPHGKRKWNKLYILWRYNLETQSWIEIARTQCHSDEWCETLREPARIALGKTSWDVVPSVAEVITRIRGMLDKELAELEDGAKRQVLGELHDQFAARLVAADAA
jgi:hypothetical protein